MTLDECRAVYIEPAVKAMCQRNDALDRQVLAVLGYGPQLDQLSEPCLQSTDLVSQDS